MGDEARLGRWSWAESWGQCAPASPAWLAAFSARCHHSPCVTL